MPLPISKRQVELLGKRLSAGAQSADIETLHEVLAAYAEALRIARSRVVELTDAPVTSRVKNTGTILEKLRRNDGRGLSTIQDLAGVRVIVGGGRIGQDATAAALIEAFSSAERSAKVIDRRADPRSGYRAVHLVISIDGLPVEIQLRTDLQHRWAELFEKLADELGRGIRYGQPPESLVPIPPERIVALSEVSPEFGRSTTFEELLTSLALGLSDTLDAFEVRERGYQSVADRLDDFPNIASAVAEQQEQLAAMREDVHRSIDQFGPALKALSERRRRSGADDDEHENPL